ncbi:MAG TPA: hypothetical protein VE669_00480, partial [Actinomycetota bacterium]|nr:hypothetical protein [Actinomycetota bacterium]
TLHALQYARTIRARETHAVHVGRDAGRSSDLQGRWEALDLDVPLRVLRHEGDPAASIAGYAAALAGDADVTVIVPGPARIGPIERVRRGRSGARLARALAPYDHVRVTLVRDHAGHAPSPKGHPIRRPLPRADHRAIVLVDRPDRASLRAVRYALSLGATDVRAVHAAADPDLQQELIARWMDLRLPVPLDLVECWDREVARSLERYVVERMTPMTEVTVVIPRRDYATLRQRLLHDRTSRRISRALGRYEHVDLAIVPYLFPKHPGPTRAAAGSSAR